MLQKLAQSQHGVVVLMDIEMPDINSFKTIPEVEEFFLKLSVLMQAIYRHENKVFEVW